MFVSYTVTLKVKRFWRVKLSEDHMALFYGKMFFGYTVTVKEIRSCRVKLSEDSTALLLVDTQ